MDSYLECWIKKTSHSLVQVKDKYSLNFTQIEKEGYILSHFVSRSHTGLMYV